MQIEILNTKADYIIFFNLYYYRKNSGRLFILMPFFLICTYNASLGQHHTINWEKFILIVLSFFAILYLLPLIIYFIRLNIIVLKNPSVLDSKKISLLTDKITIDSLSIKASIEWKNIISIYQITNYTYLKFSDNKYFLIPNRFFPSPIDADRFYKNIYRNISTIAPTEKPLNGAHLYWWGIVGFMPNFGVISGLVLLYKGIFTYKNNNLIAIGIASILFTFIFWAIMIPKLLLLSQHH